MRLHLLAIGVWNQAGLKPRCHETALPRSRATRPTRRTLFSEPCPGRCYPRAGVFPGLRRAFAQATVSWGNCRTARVVNRKPHVPPRGPFPLEALCSIRWSNGRLQMGHSSRSPQGLGAGVDGACPALGLAASRAGRGIRSSVREAFTKERSFHGSAVSRGGSRTFSPSRHGTAARRQKPAKNSVAAVSVPGAEARWHTGGSAPVEPLNWRDCS